MAEDIKKQYLDKEGLSLYDQLIKAYVENGDEAALQAAKDYADSLADNYEAAGSVATAKQELEVEIGKNTDAIAENKATIETLNGSATTAGSVAKAVADAKSELNETIAGVQGELDAAEDRITAVEEKAAANEASIGNKESLETTNKADLVSAINEVRNAVSAGGTAAAITMDTTTTTDGALKSYTIKQGDNVIGTIDIPKDMVVQEGSVVTLAENEVAGYAAGTYIKLILANVADPLYINVGTLVDLYTAQQNATKVQLTIDSASREISAVIVAGAVGTEELADGAVTTVKIADGNVTKAKLSTEVQASLDKADSALADAKEYVDDLDAAMAERVKAVEDAVAVTKDEAGNVVTVQDQIADAKAEAVTEATTAAAADATEKADAAEAAAKEYTDALATGAVATNAADIDKLEESLAEGGATATAIADAKKAGTDAAAAAATAQQEVDAVEDRVAELEGLVGEGFERITEDQINGLFATA